MRCNSKFAVENYSEYSYVRWLVDGITSKNGWEFSGLLLYSAPDVLCLVSVELQSIGWYPFSKVVDACLQTRQTTMAENCLLMQVQPCFSSKGVRLETMTIGDLDDISFAEKKSKGPRTLRCGTPHYKSDQVYCSPLKSTVWVRLQWHDLIHSRTNCERLICSQVAWNMSWSTVSNADDRYIIQSSVTQSLSVAGRGTEQSWIHLCTWNGEGQCANCIFRGR